MSQSEDSNIPSTRGSWRGVAIVIGLMFVGLIAAYASGVFDRGPAKTQKLTSDPIPDRYDSGRAFGYLEQLCDLGPRPSGSQSMERQQKFLAKILESNGADVSLQTFEIRHPETGETVPMANVIASWHSERPKRFLLCAHYDTRPFPDQDRVNRRGTFVGANDGASGVAALVELSHQFSDLPSDVGVDVVLFDGEEFVFDEDRDDYFLGSSFFAEKYNASPPAIPYRAGVLLDMVGDRELKLYYESNSLEFAPDVVRSIWDTADKLGVRAFVPRRRHRVDDDHVPLNQIAKIPTIDIIDFDYPSPGLGAPQYWHTEQDIPQNCSGESLAAVVWVVHQWLLQQ